MKLYKPTYKDKSGKNKKCNHYYLTFTDNRGNRRRLPAYSNKRASEKLSERIEELLSSGGILSPELQRWAENLSEKMRDNLIKFGLINQQRISHIGKPLADHVKDFGDSLRARTSAKYAKQSQKVVSEIFQQCGFETTGDIDANRLYTHLADLRGEDGIGERTFNAYLKSTQQFCRWMVKERRTTINPLEHLSGITQTEKRRKRRALTLEEQRLLIEAATTGRKHHKMTGYERALLYRMALKTGLRKNELRNLTVSCFDFDNRTVTLTGAYTKNKKLAILTLPPTLAADMKAYILNKLPNTRVFAVPDHPAKMIKIDLETADIEYKTEQGQMDFHSLRHCFITNLARAGVHPSDAMALARHSTITLTMDFYTHTRRDSLQGIIDGMPDLTTNKQNKRTG